MTTWILVFIVPMLDVHGEIPWGTRAECLNAIPQLEIALKMDCKLCRGKELGQFANYGCVPNFEWESE